MKMHLRESRTLKFSGGTCPRTPLGLNTLRAFGKYTRLLLLSTRLRKNLLKPLLLAFLLFIHSICSFALTKSLAQDYCKDHSVHC